MEVIHQHMLDDAYVDFDTWCHDVSANQFYGEEGLFSKQGGIMQDIKGEIKFESHVYGSKQSSFLLDACVPEYEASTLSCSSLEDMTMLRVHQQQQSKGSWDASFSKNVLISPQSEDSVSQVPCVVPDIVDENETFQDLTELLEQEYPLSKSSPPHSLCNDFNPAFDVRPSSSSSSLASSRSEDSQQSLATAGSFSADFKYESPSGSKKPDNRYKEMRRKNNIASKNARVARRDKERQMEERAKQLEEDNHLLRIKVRRMEEVAQELKAKLIQSVTRSK